MSSLPNVRWMGISQQWWSHSRFGVQQTISSGWWLLPHLTPVAGNQQGEWAGPAGRGDLDCSKGRFYLFIKTTISTSWKDSEHVPRGVPVYSGSNRGYQCDPLGGWFLRWRQQRRGILLDEWNCDKAQLFHYLQKALKLVEIRGRSAAIYKNAADCNVSQQLPQVVMVTKLLPFLLTVSQFHF